MGTWGTSIFADDTTAEVRDSYRELIASGVTDADALRQIKTKFLDVEPSIRSAIESRFWLALARTQWEIGRLDDKTKAKAFDVIDSGKDIETWRTLGATEPEIKKRAKVLADLRRSLQS